MEWIMDDQMPNTPGKFKRFVIELEVEMTDPVAAAAHNMNWTQGEDGPAMMQSQGDHEEIKQAVGGVISNALANQGPQAGFKLISMSTLDRFVDDDGNFLEFPSMPAMPGRNDDGSMNEL